jgi:S-(hydroxymethyl)glutathione dehydrogenase / alcohol dehydrogenase
LKAAICYEYRKPLVVEDGVTVDKPGKGEVKVKVAVTALCHSDLHFFTGEIPGKLPGLAGHETAGYIDEVGPDVTNFKPGDTVIIGTVSSGCGHCYYCTIGLRHLCLNRGGPAQGHSVNSKGQRLTPWAGPVAGFAEYTTVNQMLVTKIPKDMPLDRAALLACGVSTGFGAVVNRAQVKALSSVVIMGSGGVGMNVAQAAAFVGAQPIIAVDIEDSKLEMARKFGATATVNSKTEKDPVDAVKKLTSGRGADYVFVTVGSLDALRQGFNMSGPRGMTIILGLMQGNLSAFTPMDLLMGERMLTGCGGGSLRTTIDIPALVEMYKTGRLKLDELITARYPLAKINDAIESLAGGKALRNLIMME